MVDFKEYSAQWGCDPCYDQEPRMPGDGYLFYNFAVEGFDLEFLENFLPAIERTISGCKDKKDKKDRKDLEKLKNEVEKRLKKQQKLIKG